MARAGIGHDDDGKAGGAGGEMARHGVLEGNRFGRRDAERATGGGINIGRGFRMRHVVAADHGGEPVCQSQACEVAIHVIVVGVGGHAEFQAGGVSMIKQRLHAREDELTADDLAFARLEFGFQIESVDFGGERFPRIEGDALMADDGVTAGAIEDESAPRMDFRPRIDEWSFRIQNKAVEIEDEGFDHGARCARSRRRGKRFDRCETQSRLANGIAAAAVFATDGVMQHTEPTVGRLHCGALAGLTLLLAAAPMTNARPETRNRAEIADAYKWDVGAIYSSWAEWEADMAAFDAMIGDFAALQGTIKTGDAASLAHAYELADELGKLQYKLYRYPQLQRDVEMTNSEVSGNFQRVMALFAKFGTATSWFTPELLELEEAQVRGWIDTEPRLTPYRFPILEAFRQAEHTLDADGEKLLSFASQFNGTPRSIYQELSTSDIAFPTISLSTGEEVKLSYGGYTKVLDSARAQEDRRAAFEGHYKTYADNKNTYAAIYNGVLQRDWFAAQARGYATTLEAALDGNHVPIDVYKNLVSTVRAGTAPLQRYLAVRKRMLELDTYHLYDGSLALLADDRTYAYDDVKATVLESVTPLGEEYRDRMAELLDGRWLDVYENDGKRSGAYNAGVYGVGTYMLMNYNDTLDAVFTFAHEAGHAMHTLLSYDAQPFATASYTIFVAEVASTTNERFLLELLLSRTVDPKERFLLLQQAIDDIVGTFYAQVLFADYEWQAHQRVEQGQPITPDSLSKIYADLLDAYYGDAVEKDELYRYTWTRIPHFYNSPYYVYQYATCFASSAQLFKAMTTGSEGEQVAARARYIELLRSGGNDHPMEQLRKAGVDLAKPETIQAVIDQMDELVSRLEVEAERIKQL